MKYKYVVIACLIFAIISILSTRLWIMDDGVRIEFDHAVRMDMDSFREYFFSLSKSNGIINLDLQKRIIMDWIYLFITEQQEQIFHFTLAAFSILFVFYLVSIKLLEKFKYNLSEQRVHIISFVSAFIYFANPLCIRHFSKFLLPITYALFPLALYSLVMTFNSNKIRYPVLFGTVTAVLFLLIIHSIVYIGLSLLAVALVFFYFNKLFSMV